MKMCSKCKETKPQTDFGRRPESRDGLQYNCRACNNEASRRWKGNNPDRVRWQKYGLTDAEYLTMLVLQDSQCAICSVDFAPGKTTCGHVDHDHATGRVRQLLCGECNIGLGKFRDDPDLLRGAADYLEAVA